MKNTHSISKQDPLGASPWLWRVAVLLRWLPVLLAIPVVVNGQVVPNGSFEQNDWFRTWPGYSVANAPILGWTAVPAERAGLNPVLVSAAQTPFANNGQTPDAVRVAFVQSLGAPASLSTTLAGLNVGERYRLSFWANARARTDAVTMTVKVGGETVLSRSIAPAAAEGNTGVPYQPQIVEFVAKQTSMPLEVQCLAPRDGTLLLDRFELATASRDRWFVSPWTDDASTGITTNVVFAYNFGGTTSTQLNGRAVPALPNGNPTDGFYLVTSGLPYVFRNHANSLTALTGSGSAMLAADFIYGGNPAKLGFRLLVPGVTYVATFLGVGFDASGGRVVTFDSLGAKLTVDEDLYGKGNGIRLDHAFTPDATSREITVSPATAATFHLYAVALRKSLEITTLDVDQEESGRAVLRATVKSSDGPALVWFEYGSGSAGSELRSAASEVLAGSSTTPVGVSVSGVDPLALYRVRAMASNRFGISFGKQVLMRFGATNRVTSATDSGPGSLRTVLATAQYGDVIQFDPALAGSPIALRSGPLQITSRVTLDGSTLPGGITLDGARTNALIRVAAGAIGRFKQVHLVNGYAIGAAQSFDIAPGTPPGPALGGAIRNEGTVFYSDGSISGNAAIGGDGYTTAGAPEPLRWFASPGAAGGGAFGGAIHNSGRMVLNRATLSDNTARGGLGQMGLANPNDWTVVGTAGIGGLASGAAIANTGSLVLNQCTLTGNRALGGPGGRGMYARNLSQVGGPGGQGGAAIGGAIHSDGELEVNQCTVVGNRSEAGSGGEGGGAVSDGAQGPSGIAGSGSFGGVARAAGTAIFLNSILTENLPPEATPGVTLLGNNLLSGSAGLAALDTYGGPTRTMPMLPGSAAYARGDARTLNSPYGFKTDQRGLPRQVGGVVSLGAVEMVLTQGRPTISSAAFDFPAGSDPINGNRPVRFVAMVAPNWASTAAWIEYGVDGSPLVSLGKLEVPIRAGASPVPIEIKTVQLLSPNVRFQWRVVATNAQGTTVLDGAPFQIATGSTGTPPKVPGDVNRDGTVSLSEWNEAYQAYRATAPSLSGVLRSAPGDVDLRLNEASTLTGFAVEVSTDLETWESLGVALPAYRFNRPSPAPDVTTYYRLRP